MGLLIFLLLALATPAPAALNGFHYVDQRKTWTEAQSYCREKFTDLATIHTQDHWTTVRDMVANSAHSMAWLGLYDDVKSWRWSLDNTSLYSRELGSWFTLTADNYDGHQHCADIGNGQLYDHNCGGALRSVCYNETADSYVTVPEPMSWQLAQTYCREHHTDLASIRHQQELNAIINLTVPNQPYWIGLSREGWKWSGQSHSSVTYWKSGEPRGYYRGCGAADDNGWYSKGCDEKLPFICSVPPVQHSLVLRVAVESDGSVNMNDPALQEAILKQVEERLRAQGLTQPLSLSWRKQPNGQVWFNKTEL